MLSRHGESPFNNLFSFVIHWLLLRVPADFHHALAALQDEMNRCASLVRSFDKVGTQEAFALRLSTLGARLKVSAAARVCMVPSKSELFSYTQRIYHNLAPLPASAISKIRHRYPTAHWMLPSRRERQWRRSQRS